MKKFALTLLLIVLLSIIGISMAAESAYIAISEKGNTTDSIGSLKHAAGGLHYLVVDMVIENHGYPEFNVNPNYFLVTAKNIDEKYRIDSATFYLGSLDKDPLPTVKLADGENINGSLVFLTRLRTNEYDVAYSGPGDYTIYWNAPGSSVLSPL